MILSVTRLICTTSHSLSSVLALKRNRIRPTGQRKVSHTGNCHAYACSSLCLSVCPHVSASHCLAVRLSGCLQRLSNSRVILGCPCMEGLSAYCLRLLLGLSRTGGYSRVQPGMG